MVRVVSDDAVGAVQLFAENQPRHGVRQGQAGEAKRGMGALFQALVDAVGTADDKGGIAAFAHPGFKALRQFEGVQILAAFVEHDQPLKPLQGRLQTAFLGGQQLFAGF